MTLVRVLGDAVGLLAFLAAAVVTALTPPARDGRGRPITKWLLVVAFALYALVTASDLAGDLGITSAGDAVVDFAEALFPLAVLGIMFAKHAAQQYDDATRARKALQQSHDLMLDIVDGAPAGIMFLDSAGRITFANEAAKHALDLEEDDARITVKGAGWTIRDVRGTEPGDLLPLVSAEPYDARPFTFEWPEGGRVHLSVSGRPLADQSEKLGGVVVTFERA